MTDKTYNGHKNWTYWNVSLWLNNDEGLYRLMLDSFEVAEKRKRRAATIVVATLKREGTLKTPDGAAYSVANVMAAMEGLE